MSRSEFRWNKKRKHYACLFKDKGNLRFNIIITTKQNRIVKGKIKANIKLFKHPNPNCHKDVYVIPFVYLDSFLSFYEKVYKWNFDINDKRMVKRIKKQSNKNKKGQH